MRVTNSFGMANPEYGYEKPPHTRRVAWLGDSVSVGPYGGSFETLLENRLNQDSPVLGIEKFQMLNFSVPGYILLQKMDVALEKAPKFHPDIYIVQLDSQEIVGPRKHIAKMVVERDRPQIRLSPADHCTGWCQVRRSSGYDHCQA